MLERLASETRIARSAAWGRDPETDPPDVVVKLAAALVRQPERVTVEAPDATLTRGQVDRLSNQLAHRLIALGVGVGSYVGISLPRGAGELVAMLATLKAGGAYVPLDPSHPTDRLRLVLEDAAPDVLILHPRSPLAEAAPGSAHVLHLEDLASVTTGFDPGPLSVPHDPAQIAYVLFTSGSTGRPKGVEVPRGAFANFLRSMEHTPGIQESDRLLAISTTSFDIAGLELFLPLYAGATVVIVDRDTAVDPRKLRQQLEGGGITFMQATPATWRLLLESGWRGDGKLKMLCGGEAMSASLADRLLAAGGQLWNMYGPTETTVWSTLERIRPGYERITIGKPIDRTQIYLLDEARNLVPAGQVGEIYIGGNGLARGYRGRPDLTSERFIQNPHGPPGDRIYRTGDLGRLLPNGSFECLGRIDHQVKIRGYRIELGEIEAVLRGVPDVAEVVVTADEQEGDPRLCAYWVGGATREALIAEARRKLPSYMVPVAYVHIDAFPLTPNGKIDRKGLPRPDAQGLAMDRSDLKQPRHDAETRIAVIWKQLLGLSEVGVDEDFFTLGGTSVLAVELRARIERDMNIEMPLRVFFECPTVEGLASHLGKVGSPDEPAVVWLRQGAAGKPPLFCLFGIHLYQDLARVLGGDRPVVGMHVPFRYVPGRDSRPTIPQMARGYVELIRRYQPRGPYHLAGLCFGGVAAFEAARQLEDAGEEVALVVNFDGMIPYAVEVDHVRWARRALEIAVREPERVSDWLREKSRPLAARLPFLSRLLPRETVPDAESGPAKPIDFDVVGKEADDDVRLFASTVRPIAGRLLVIRATESETIGWIKMGPDMGWAGLAERLFVEDVACHHLGLLREPNVGKVAAAIARALE